MQLLMQTGHIALISALSSIGLEKEVTKANRSKGSRSSRTIFHFGNHSADVSLMPHIPTCNAANPVAHAARRKHRAILIGFWGWTNKVNDFDGE
jgi:hypothetical protein